MPNSSKIRFSVHFDLFRETNLQIVTIQYLLMVYVTSLKIRFSRAHFEGGVYYIEKRIVTKPRRFRQLWREIFVYGIRHHPLPGETMRS